MTAYQRMFISRPEPEAKSVTYDRGGPAQRVADWRRKPVYHYTPEIELHVNIALATARPLLVRGKPGSGKSSLARNIAERLGWRYYDTVVTSRTQARDLLYTFDSLRRLNDAQVDENREIVAEPANYIEPGPVWWAFDRKTALRRGMRADLPEGRRPHEPYHEQQPDSIQSVLLIDEIDKADPDLPNALLVPLGGLHFHVEETNTPVHASPEAPPLLVITTNEERELPAAFVRRCVVLKLDAPGRDRLIAIANLHFEGKSEAVYGPIADRVNALTPAGETVDSTLHGPSTAEYLDAVWACAKLGVSPDSKEPEKLELWRSVEQATLIKGRNMGNA